MCVSVCVAWAMLGLVAEDDQSGSVPPTPMLAAVAAVAPRVRHSEVCSVPERPIVAEAPRLFLLHAALLL